MSTDASFVEESGLPAVSVTLGIDQALTAGVWVDVLTVNVGAGTWIAWAAATLFSGALETVSVRVTDGVSEYGSQTVDITNLGIFAGIGVVSEPIILAVPGTLHLQGFSQAALAVATVKASGDTTKATRLFALRIAP